jgi:hypothetical protein
MKIVICCEGSTDVGPLTVLVKKCATVHNLDVDCRTHDELKEKITLLKSEFPKDFIKNNDRFNRVTYILRSFGLAKILGCKSIAYHQDSGHQDFREVYNSIHKDFKTVLPNSIKRLAMVPKEMTESWLLADVKAINLLGDGTKTVDMSKNPENLWGDKHDPNSNYPKNYLKRNLDKLGVEYNSESCTRIAENADIEILKHRCPLSFGQFYSDMQAFIITGSTP